MRHSFIALCITLGCALQPAHAQVSVSVNIGINVPAYPQMVVVPGYPVYYAPQVRANFFFYDGMYWVFEDDSWYMSAWYNGPWQVVAPVYVPYYVLRVPVRYYRAPPPYFRPWAVSAPPRWGQHWGPQWERQHRGWDRWDRNAAPRPAPLPSYQRRYAGDRYPHREQQAELLRQNYRYQPRSSVAKEQYQRERYQAQPAQQRPPQQQHREARQQEPRRSEPRQQQPWQMQQHPQPHPQQQQQQQQPQPRIEHRQQAPEQRGWQGQGQVQGQERDRGRRDEGGGGKREQRDQREERGRGHDK